MRLFVAAILSSLAIVPLYLALLAVSGGLDTRVLLPMLVAALVLALLATIFVGIPLHLLLVRLGRSRFYYYALVGFVVPAVFTLARNPFDSDVSSWVKWQALAMGVLGASVAVIFWKVATGGLPVGGSGSGALRRKL